MLVDARPLWFAATNAYVVARGKGEPAVIVDAPPDPEAVIDLVSKHDLIPTAVLVTHGHVDHVGGAADVARLSGAVTYMHPDDEWLALDPTSQLMALFGAGDPGTKPLSAYTKLGEGQRLELAGLEIDVLHTPGHTPGHCCFHIPAEGMLFSGDQLFAGSIGRWDLPGGDLETLLASMRDRVLPLPGDTEVLPGHGPPTTLARERRSNPFLQDLL